jgi:hypothetical protein
MFAVRKSKPDTNARPVVGGRPGAAVLVATHDDWVADAADRVVDLRPSA